MVQSDEEKTSRYHTSNFTWDDLKREIERQNHKATRYSLGGKQSTEKRGSLEALQRHFQSFCEMPPQDRLSPGYASAQTSYIKLHVHTIHNELQDTARKARKFDIQKLRPYMLSTSSDAFVQQKRERHSKYTALEDTCLRLVARVDKIKSFDQRVRAEAQHCSRHAGKLEPGFLPEFDRARWDMMLKNRTWWTRAKILFFRNFLFLPWRLPYRK